MNIREGAVSAHMVGARRPGCALNLRQWSVAACVLLLSGFAHAGDLPDPYMTPGAIDPTVTQQNIDRTVCVKGYTKTIRPPANYTNSLKKRQIRQYRYADTNVHDYEEDHLIALSIGGSPYDPHNLWPEPRHSEWGAEKKDQLEFVMYKMVCARQISLLDAQRAMASDWIAAWNNYVRGRHGVRFGKID